MQIWDTAGQERFRGLAKNYYRGADAVVLVYDVTQARTFVDVPSWLEELESFSLDERNILQVIVANKVSFQKYFYAIFYWSLIRLIWHRKDKLVQCVVKH